MQALRGPHHRNHVRVGPHRPRAPVSFAAQAQNLQALCLECHRNKTALESSHATTLESRFSRRAYEQYVESPRLPPLVFKLNSHKPDHICHGIDVARCRKNGLAHAKFPAPIFCPKDNVEQAREGHLADLTYVRVQAPSLVQHATSSQSARLTLFSHVLLGSRMQCSAGE